MVLIVQATSEGSGEAAHPRSLARAFAVGSHEVWKFLFVLEFYGSVNNEVMSSRSVNSGQA